MIREITIVIRPTFGFRNTPMQWFVNLIRLTALHGIAFEIISATDETQ